jgi:DNA-binding MarR family transcriptional regulator
MPLDEFDDGWPPEREHRFDTRVVASVHGACHAITRRLDLSTRQHGIDSTEALVLATVMRNPGCAPFEVRAAIGLHRSTLSSVLDRLERDGRISRRASDFDGRRFEIRLTRAGDIAADLAMYEIDEVEAEIAGYTSRSQRHGSVAVYHACLAIGRRERGISD